VSALTNEGIPELLAELGALLRPVREFLELAIPHGRAAIISRMHQVGQVVESNYEDGDVARFKVRIPPHFHHEFEPYLVKALQTA
jgi:GTP-binding protein HflX